MKKAKFLLFAGLVCLLAVGCHKDGVTLDKFMMGNTNFKANDDSKVALEYNGNRLLYEESDVIKVNGETFTLSKSGSGSSTVWYANGNSISATEFYCAYADGVSTTLSNYSGSTYHYNLGGRLSSATNKILLGGVTENNVLTLRPACAIIRVPLNDSYTNVKVGFERNKVYKEGTLNIGASEVTISGMTYMTGVDQYGTGADFLMMEYNSTEGYWYVAVPVSSSVTTKLYFFWKQGSDTTAYVTSGQVTLNKGYVYTAGSSRQSPFNADGTSKCLFKVDDERGHYVRFSPGNLQANFITRTEWRFAPSQTAFIGSSNSSNIQTDGAWFDLFGFGTSDWSSGAARYKSYDYQGTSANYIQHDLTGSWANADWGVNNGSSIKYGTVTSGTTWKTLTRAEWNYLITRSGKWGLATVGGVQGLMLLPDFNASGTAWDSSVDLADCPAFTAGATSYSTNNYNSSQWGKFEAAGVVFLPAAGYREGTSVTLSGYARYWSSSYYGFDGFQYLAYALGFSSGTISVTEEDNYTSNGYAVRLVHQEW